MSGETPQIDITKLRAAYTLPAEEAVVVRRELEYRVTETGPLTLDVYTPPDAEEGEARPAVIFLTGYPDPGFEALLGCRIKDMESYTSWSRLVAASGLVAITYCNELPAEDALAVLRYVGENAESLGVDAERLGFWSGSGNVPNALSILMGEAGERLSCGVLFCGFTLDTDGSNVVADAAAQWGFVNPCAGCSVADLPATVPLFVVRGGQDSFVGLNEAMDRFCAAALARNLPLTIVNHAGGPHAFDIFEDSDASRHIVAQSLAFLRFHLLNA